MCKSVFRSASQQYDRDKVTTYNKSKDLRVMVWAAISTASLSDLMVIRRDKSAPKQGYTTRSYIKVLEDGLLPILQANSIYQQDGARIHTSKLAIAWFEKHRVHVLKYWPPYSPDLNPIKHTSGHYSKKRFISSIQTLKRRRVERIKWPSVWKMHYAMHGVQFAIKSHIIV